MPAVEVKVFYLEMLAHCHRDMRVPRPGLAVIHAQKPSVAWYRFLYNAVGQAYYWYSRGSLPDADLAAVLANPLNEVHVLFADGCPAGFAELDRRSDDVELVQFGLLPEYVGCGLGKYFLQWTIDRVWSYQPRRLWLHTCTLDHPAALPNYLKAGFAVFKEETRQRQI